MALSAQQQLPAMDYPGSVSSTDQHLLSYQSAAAVAHQPYQQHHQQHQQQHQQQQQQMPQYMLDTSTQNSHPQSHHPEWCQPPSSGPNIAQFAQQYNTNSSGTPYHQQPQSQYQPLDEMPTTHSHSHSRLDGDFHMSHIQHAEPYPPLFAHHPDEHAASTAAVAAILSPTPTSSSTCDSPPEFVAAAVALHQRTPNNGLRTVAPAGTESAFSSVDSGLLSTPSHQSAAAAAAAWTAGSGGLAGTAGGSGGGGGAPGSAENSRRGRPRSEALTTLMIEGSTSPSAIKCTFCNRVFPREKSLQAHLRTHTGERPYPCDYPGCTRAFTQSGQLKTHQRLHTGERPFMCSAPVCQQRFTHANRHCPDHPYGSLRRCDDSINVASSSEQNAEVLRWLEKYRAEKEERTPSRRTPKRTPKRVSWSAKAKATASALALADGAAKSTGTGAAGCVNNSGGGAGNANQENVPLNGGGHNYATAGHHPNGSAAAHLVSAAGPTGTGTPVATGGRHHAAGSNRSSCAASPSTPINPRKSRKGLMVELDMNAGMGASPIATKLKAPQPKQIQWTEAPMSQEEDSADDDCCDDDGDCDDDDDDDGFEAPTAQSTFNPKKRWLREAWQDDLARPLEPQPLGPTGLDGAAAAVAAQPAPVVEQQQQQPLPLQPQQQHPAQSAAVSSSAVAATSAAAASYINPNQMRPSVLMIASKDRTMPLVEHQRQMYAQQPLQPVVNYAGHSYAAPIAGSQHQSPAAASCFAAANPTNSPSTPNRKWMGAMALMQLSSNEEAAALPAAVSHTSSPSITSSRPESVALDAAQQFQLYRAKP